MNKPELKSTYYVPCIVGVDGGKCVSRRWDGDRWDNMLFERGIVCETQEEAEALFDIIVSEAQQIRKNLAVI